MTNTFTEIKTEYDYFTLFIYNRKIQLTYRIRQYQKLKNQDKDYIAKLKKQGIKLKHYKRMNKDKSVTVVYYKLYNIQLTPLKYRKILIDKIMASLHTLGHTLKDEIETKWNERHCHKTTTTELMDRESIILDTLSSYYIGGYEGKGILNQKTWRAVTKEECASFNELYDNETKSDDISKKQRNWEVGQYNNKRLADFIKKNKIQVKRWKKTTTYKLFSLYSFKNHKEEIKEWDWITESARGLNEETFVTREGIINPEQPYKVKWCYVNADNEFEFEGRKYRIDPKVEGYKFIIKRNRKGEFEVEWSSDHILVFSTCPTIDKTVKLASALYLKQPEVNKDLYTEMKFYDMNINPIESKMIMKVDR